jgi:ubiquinone/menaquinone biosynthesis C-methylase UbiE
MTANQSQMRMRKDDEVFTCPSDLELDYHRRQYDRMYRSTAFAIKFLKEKAGFNEDTSDTVIDLGGGAGANVYWLSKEFPNMNFTVCDINRDLIELGKKRHHGDPMVSLVDCDFFKLDDLYEPGSFDYAVSFQTLLIVDYGKLIKSLAYIARKGVFLLSLFCNGPLEFHNKIIDRDQGKEITYSVYSLEKFAADIETASGRPCECVYEPFEIDIDLPKPEKARLQTYTILTADNKRLQFSGSMLMPWCYFFCRFLDE